VKRPDEIAKVAHEAGRAYMIELEPWEELDERQRSAMINRVLFLQRMPEGEPVSDYLKLEGVRERTLARIHLAVVRGFSGA
jgi:hypothetical protein